MRLLAGLAIAACVFALPVQAQEETESPSLVPVFVDACLMAGVKHEDRIAAVEQSDQWEKQPRVSFRIPLLQVSRAIGGKPRFADFTDASQWDGKIDGRKASIVLLSFSEKSRYNHACILFVEGLQNAMPYGGDLRAAFKEFGIGGKSVDLVHYYEFAGTLKPGKQPVETKRKVHGEIFSRSLAGSIKETTHIYVAY